MVGEMVKGGGDTVICNMAFKVVFESKRELTEAWKLLAC